MVAQEGVLGESGQGMSASQFVVAIKRCSKMRDLEGGKKLHQDAVLASFHTNNFVAATLITMYSKCRAMPLAREVFEGLFHRDSVTWNSLILGYVQNGESSVAMDLFFTRMDCQPDAFTYVAVLKACGGLASEKVSEKQLCLQRGTEIHRQLRNRGFDSDMVVGSALVFMYSKCGSMDSAREVFDRMVTKDVVTWNTLILGYVENGKNLVALDLFAAMECETDSISYLAALKACAALASEKETEKQVYLQKGIAIHKQVKDSGFDSNIVVANTLVDMYSKCGNMVCAKEVFNRMPCKNVATWTSLMLGYVQNGNSLAALDLFDRMDCEPDSVTFVSALKACSGLVNEKEDSDREFCLQKGIAIHKQIKDHGFESGLFVGSSLVDMYSKCGSMDCAKEVFDRMISKDVITWTSLILGYVNNGESSAALDLFSSMSCEPNYVTYAAAVQACGALASLAAGLEIHARVCKLGLEQDQELANTLVDFYGKCGSMSRAEETFNSIQNPDLVSWNALIAGYSSIGDPSRVYNLVKEMQEGGLQMDSITCTCVLTTCSRAGLVEQGKQYFESMLGSGGGLNVEHYTCMIDMLGRANKLQEALVLVQKMPFEADSVTWTTLLGACRQWKNMAIGKIAFDALVASGTADSGAYVLMSEIYKSSQEDQELSGA